MKAKLAIAISADRLYTDVNIKRPSAEIIAQTVEMMANKNEFTAMKKFVSGCIESFIGDDEVVIEDKTKINELSNKMPYKSNELLAIQIMQLYNPEDGIGGVYKCPYCNKTIIAQKDQDGDSLDYIKNLTINYSDNIDYVVEFKEPITIKLGQEYETIKSIKARYSIIEDYEKSYHLINQPFKMQWAVNLRCIMEVNERIVDDTWKKRFGSMMFENIMNKDDLNAMQRTENKYGLDTTVKKFCMNCRVEFPIRVNTANFFASGLE